MKVEQVEEECDAPFTLGTVEEDCSGVRTTWTLQGPGRLAYLLNDTDRCKTVGDAEVICQSTLAQYLLL